MITDFYIEPESDEQLEFIELLSVARDYGQEETEMSSEELAVIFNQFAIGLLKGEEENTDQTKCPECGEVVNDVETLGMGMDPVVQPCGCEVSFEMLDDDQFLNESQ